MSQRARRASRGRALKIGVPDVAAFTKLPCAATDLKSTFNYHVVSNTTREIDFTVSIVAAGKTDSERLLRLQGHEKLDCAHDGKVRIFAPLGQSCEDFIEDQYARHNWRAWEMAEQAGMICVDCPVTFKVHLTTFRSRSWLRQPGRYPPNDSRTTHVEQVLCGVVR